MQAHPTPSRFLKMVLFTFLVLLTLGTSSSVMGQDAPRDLDPFSATSDFTVLRAAAQRAGSLRVIVGVSANLAGAASDSARQQLTQAAQNSVLASLAGHNVQVVNQFKYIPFMVLVVDVAALDALRANPLVTLITNDALSRPTMDTSVNVIGVGGVGGAWDLGYDGTGTVVAILDTGVDKVHPFLADQVVAEACFNTTYAPHAATSRCPGGVDTSTASDSGVDCLAATAYGCEHGTHVAGTVASKDATYRGVAPGAKLIAINVFSHFESVANCSPAPSPCVLSYITDQVEALEHVYSLRNTHNIVSLNMSLGGGQFFDEASCDTNVNNVATKAIIDLLRAANIASVIATGNNSFTNSMGAPGCISSAVAVGATTDADVVAPFSNVATFMEFYAPGVDINSADAGGAGHKSLQGTSMATPHVAGTWALLRQAKPSATVTQLVDVLTETGVLIDAAIVQDKPRIQVNDALVALTKPSQPTGLVANAVSQTQIDLSWTDVADETGYRIERSPDGSTGWTEVGTNPADDVSFSDTGLTCNTPYHYRVIATHTVGGDSDPSTVATDTTDPCVPPQPTGLTATAVSETQIDLSWTDVAGETGYSIERSPDGTAGWTEVGTNAADDVSFSDTGLTCDTAYYYRVIATSGGGDSEPSDAATATTNACTVPQPTGLTATAVSETQIDLSWTDVAGETGYSIERSPDGTAGWTEVGTNAADDVSFSDTGLTCNTTYHYRVIATSGSGDSEPSDAATATTNACTVPQPTGLTATAVSETQIDLSWTDVAGETGYSIERSPDGTAGWTEVGTNPADDVSFSDTGLTCNTTYHYRVIATSGSGDSEPSDAASATTNACTVPQPTGLTATAVSETQIDLSWTDVAGETGYSIERSPDGTTGWTEVGTNAADDVSFSDTGLTCNTTYHYRVIATSGSGNSEPSDAASATTNACTVPQPTGLTATAVSETQIDLSWTDVAGETGYSIERSPDGTTGWTEVGTNAADDVSFSDTGLTCNTTYHYRVIATSGSGTSEPSDAASATTNACGVVPQPTGLTATAVSETQIDLSWTDVAGETGYSIERSPDGTTGWTEVGTNAANATTFGDSGLTCNTTYHYRVIATSEAGNSAPSDPASATTNACSAAEIELLINGSFDDNDDATPKLPDSWVGFGPLLGDKVRADGAVVRSRSAPNMVQFKGRPGEATSILLQNIDLVANTFSVGDTLVLSAYVTQKSAPNNLAVGKLVIKYTDGSKKTQVKLRMPASKTPGYVQITTTPFVITNADISKMNVQLYYLRPSGKYFVDDVSLKLTPAASSSGGIIDLPAAPDALRGK